MGLLLRSAIILFSLLFIWQLIVTLGQFPNYILPSPIEVITTLYLQRQLLLTQMWPTLTEIGVGFVLGCSLGSIAGGLMAYFKPLKYWLLPVLIVSQAIPTFAIAPLIVIWFGFGFASKIVTTIIMIFFPVMSAFYDGLQRINPGWIDLAKTMQANPYQLFFHIRLPAALPSLASGIRIAAVIAPIGAIVGEWVGSSQGLGYLMLNANARMQINMMFATLIVIIVLALVLYYLVDKTFKFLIWWH